MDGPRRTCRSSVHRLRNKSGDVIKVCERRSKGDDYVLVFVRFQNGLLMEEVLHFALTGRDGRTTGACVYLSGELIVLPGQRRRVVTVIDV